MWAVHTNLQSTLQNLWTIQKPTNNPNHNDTNPENTKLEDNNCAKPSNTLHGNQNTPLPNTKLSKLHQTPKMTPIHRKFIPSFDLVCPAKGASETRVAGMPRGPVVRARGRRPQGIERRF